MMREWILRLTGVSLLSAAAISLTAQGTLKKTISAICAFAVMSVMLGLCTDFDWDSYALTVQEYRLEGESLAAEGEAESRTQTRLYIQRQCEAYILDKAQALGLNADGCEVTAQWSEEGYWVPVSCTLCCDGDGAQRLVLMRWIETELGIPRSRQSYTSAENGENG